VVDISGWDGNGGMLEKWVPGLCGVALGRFEVRAPSWIAKALTLRARYRIASYPASRLVQLPPQMEIKNLFLACYPRWILCIHGGILMGHG
jgi:hypothetical protein